MTPQEVLLKAADELERHGWMQGEYGSADGPKCVAGAMRYIVRGYMPPQLTINDSDTFQAAKRLLLASISDFSLTRWNDGYSQTAENVVAALRKAAQ